MARLGVRTSAPYRGGVWPVQVAALFVAAGMLLEIAHFHPLLLPLIGAGLVAVGMLWAAVVYLRSGRNRQPDDSLIYPALIVFLGFAASIISDGDSVMRALNL